MIKKMPLTVQALTWLAGMPVGRSGYLDWKQLIAESGFKVVSIHEDLGSILKNPHAIAAEAKAYGTGTIVMTGMYRWSFRWREYVKNEAFKKQYAHRAGIAGAFSLGVRSFAPRLTRYLGLT